MVRAAGLVPDGPVAVEGLAGSAADVEGLLDDEGTRDRVLEALRRTEREPALPGASSHLLIAGRRSRPDAPRLGPGPAPSVRGVGRTGSS